MALEQRGLEGEDPRWAAIDEAGGLYVVPPGTHPSIVRDAVLRDGVRALEVQGKPLTALHDLPIEFLFTTAPDVDASVLNTLGRLRGLSLDSWVGDLDVGQLSNLEWFGVTEVDPGQLDSLWASGHARLQRLVVGRYRHTDLRPLVRLPEVHDLTIVDSRALTSVAGIGSLPRLRTLDLALCPKLDSLAGIEEARGLQSLVLDTCNRIDDLGPLERLRDLRVLQIDMRKPPSLIPIEGHVSLEFIWLITRHRPLGEIDELLSSPRLRMVTMRRHCWMLGPGGWHHIEDIYSMTPHEERRYRELLGELNRSKYA